MVSSSNLQKRNFRSVHYALSLLAGVVVIGIIGFIFIERYSFIDAFFMTIITMSTVGFNEVQPLSQAGQIFTAFLIIFSFGIFAYAVSTLTRYVVDGIFRHYFMDTKIKKQIEKLKNHVIVCGLGRNGQQAMTELSRHGQNAIIIDKNEEIIEEIRNKRQMLYIQGDATNDEVLKSANIENARALIAALPNDADNLFVVLTAKEFNPSLKIISRASEAHSDKKLKMAGATNVIMPDRIGGQRMAKLVTQPDIIDFLDHIMLQSTDDIYIEEISCDQLKSCFVEKSIGEWSIRQNTGANIVGIKTKDKKYIVNPSPDVKISSYDQLFVLGSNEQIKKLTDILTGKISP